MSLNNEYAIGQGSNEVMHVLHPRLKYPNLWRGCFGAWAPCLGVGGLKLQDNSGRGNHGTLTNMDSTDWVASEGKIALDFDGTGDHVIIGGTTDSPFNGTWIGRSAFMWVQQLKGSFSNLTLMRKGVGAPFGLLFDISLSATNMSTRLVVGGGTIIGTSRTWSDFNWHHVGFAISGNGDTTLYWDGVVDGSGTLTYGGDNTSEAFRISHSSSSLLGRMDDIRVYNRVLTPFEIAILAQRRGIAYETIPTRYRMRGSGGGPPATFKGRNMLVGCAF